MMTLGKMALQSVTGLQSVQARYGIPTLASWGGQVIPNFSPDFIAAKAEWFSEFQNCFAHFKLLVRGAWPKEKLWKATIGQQDDVTAAAIRALRPADGLEIDSETAGISPQFDKILCLGLSDGNTTVTFQWPPGLRTAQALREKLEGPGPKVFHNAQHDIIVLEAAGYKLGGHVEDTLLMHAALYPGISHSLSVACVRLMVPRWKSDFHDESEYKGGEVFAHAPMRDLMTYNSKDCYYGHMLWRTLRALLAASPEAAAVHESLVQQAQLALGMRKRGIRIDLKRRGERIAHFRRLKERSLHWWKHFVPDVDIGENGSTQAAKDFFFKTLALPVLQFTENQAPKLDAWTIQRWGAGWQCPDKRSRVLSKILLRYRHAHHMMKMAEGIAPDPDERVHPPYNPWGAKTGRWSCGRPNLFNLPKDKRNGLRDLFVPDPGKVFVLADLDKAELRAIACLAGDERLLNAFASGVDIHTQNARDLFGHNATKEHRELGKRMCYGFNYAGKATTIWESLVPRYPKLSLQIVEFCRNKWFEQHPALGAWHDRIWKEAKSRERIDAPAGPYYQDFPGGFVDRNKVFNFPCQSLIQCVVGRAMLALEKQGYVIAMYCYDELVLQVAPEQTEQAKTALVAALGAPVDIAGYGKYSFPAEAIVSKSWAH